MAKRAAKAAPVPKPAAPVKPRRAAARPAAPPAAPTRPEYDTELFARGLEMRRSVLGAAYVDRSLANADEFMVSFQKLVTEYCWGEVWTRPGLDRRHRSMLNLAMLTALGRREELKLHLRGALTNGVTRDEIKEILLQACIYAGIPAGLDAFKTAVEVFRELDAA